MLFGHWEEQTNGRLHPLPYTKKKLVVEGGIDVIPKTWPLGRNNHVKDVAPLPNTRKD